MPHKLLLADDSVTIQRVVELTFSSEDVQVLSVADGEEAIARIPIERPDIVLADIGMPRRSGYDVAAYVKDRPELAHIPVLLMAGAFEPVDEARARQVRSDGVLIKPFEPQQVIARVRELLQNSKRVEHPVLPGRQVLPDRLSIEADATEAIIPPPATLQPKETRPGPEGSLDDYFDRLDAAFAGLGGHPPRPVEVQARVPSVDSADETPIPSLEDLLAARAGPPRPIDPPSIAPPLATPPAMSVAPPPIEPPDSPPTRAPAPAQPRRAAGPVAAASPANELHGRNVVAEAFGALLAVEQGEAGASPIRLPIGHAEPVITEALIDEIARRVVERLGSDANSAVRDLVARVVSDVSERLVEQEIRRIRTGSKQ